MKSKIRILMILNRYYPIIGGAENQCRILMNNLKEYEDIEIFGVATHRYDNKLEKTTAVDDIAIFRLGLRGNTKLSILSFYFELIIFLIRNKNKFDVLHVHTISLTSFIVVLFSNIFYKKSLQKLTIADEIKDIVNRKGIKGKIFKSLVMYGLNNGNIVSLTNEGLREVLKYSSNQDRLYKINNGVDKSIFYNDNQIKAKCIYNFNSEYIYFGFVGRLTRTKGILDLCNEFINFMTINRNHKIKLVIMGSGHLQIDSVENELKVLSEKYDFIILLNSEHQPKNFYNAIDVYISNSSKEGMPNTVLEALSCEKPCVLSNIPSHIELFSDNSDSNIKIFNNYKELYDIFLNINSSLHKSKLNDKYYISNVGDSYKKLYNELF